MAIFLSGMSEADAERAAMGEVYMICSKFKVLYLFLMGI
jgi:hypothetical protein